MDRSIGNEYFNFKFCVLIVFNFFVLQCTIQTFCTMYWELVLRKTTPSIYLLEPIQQIIRIASYVFFDISVVTCCVSGQMIVVFYQNLASNIRKSMSPTNASGLCSSLHTQLSAAVSFLYRQYDLILLINCYHAVSCLLFYSDVLIREMHNPELRIPIYMDVLTLIDCLLRLWLMTHTADQIRYAVCLFNILFKL